MAPNEGRTAFRCIPILFRCTDRELFFKFFEAREIAGIII